MAILMGHSQILFTEEAHEFAELTLWKVSEPLSNEKVSGVSHSLN